MDGFGVFLTSYKNNQTIQLPVNPEELELKYETDDYSETIVNLGEVNRVGDLKLTGVTIASTLPKDKTTYLAVLDLKKPDYYINWIRKIQKAKGLVRLVVNNTKISLAMTIASFTYGFENSYDQEYTYTLELKQYRSFKAEKVKKKKKKHKSKKGKKRVAPPKKFGIHSNVIVTGRLHLDSYGSDPGMYEKKAKREIVNIAPGRKYPICVGINGIARGWVKKSDVVKA